MKGIKSFFYYTFSSILLLGLYSCGDFNQEIHINPGGESTHKISMDLSALIGMAESFGDSLDTSNPTEEAEINPLDILDNPDALPNKVDTTMTFGDPNIVASYDLTEEEIRLLNKMSLHMDVDNKASKMLLDFTVTYADLDEREAILKALNHMSTQKHILDGDTTINNEKGSALFTGMADYSLDEKLGIFTMNDSAPPETGLGDMGPDDEEMDEETLKMMEMMMPGGVTTKLTLPGKVMKVEGIEYKSFSDNTISVMHTYVDIMRHKVVKGYKVYYEPMEAITDPTFTEVWDPEPLKVKVGKENSIAPSDAVVLFGGKNANAWQHLDGSPVKWNVKKGSMTVKPGSGDIKTKAKFGDVQLHLEWRSPKEKGKEGQGLGNSGVFLQERYEVQILNSYETRTYANGQAGAIYKQHPPLVNAMRKTGKWQTYDIIFHAPKFDDEGAKISNGTLTVLHNGILIQDHSEVQGTTEYIGYPKTIVHGDGSIILQDHSNEVSFRNIWLRKL